jgi:hypothetical protein
MATSARSSARQPRIAPRCPVSNAISGVEARLDDGTGLVEHGLVWDLSRHGTCVILNRHVSYERGHLLELSLRPTLGVGVVIMNTMVCWREASSHRMFLGLHFHEEPLPQDTFLEWIITSC